MRRFPFHPSRFINDPFKQSSHRLAIEWAFGRLLHVLQYFFLAFWSVDGRAESAFDLADLDGVPGALIEQAHDHFVDATDGIADAVNLTFGIDSIHNKKPLPVAEKR
jgi:hypothetical protein